MLNNNDAAQQQQQQQQQQDTSAGAVAGGMVGGGIGGFCGNKGGPAFMGFVGPNSWGTESVQSDSSHGSCIHIGNPNMTTRASEAAAACIDRVCAVCMGCLGCSTARRLGGKMVAVDAGVVPTTEFSLACGHRFHVHCIARWLDQHTTCPCCGRIVAAITRVMLSSSQQPLPHPATGAAHHEEHLRYVSSAAEWWLGLLGVGGHEQQQQQQQNQHMQMQMQRRNAEPPLPEWISWMVTAAFWIVVVAMAVSLVK
jgi:hypothetical protein